VRSLSVSGSPRRVKMMALESFETSGSNDPATHHRLPEDSHL
jgi:hypothetical protein